MIAVFYDRKNKREVTSDKLVKIRLINEYASVDGEGCAPGTSVKYITDKYGDERLTLSQKLEGEIGYASPACENWLEWDLWCMQSDLIFLRLDPEPEEPEEDSK